MSIVDALFDKAERMADDEEMLVECGGDKKKIASIRTMMYRQIKNFQKSMGRRVDFSMNVENGNIIIKKSAGVEFTIRKIGEVPKYEHAPKEEKVKKDPFDIKVGGD